MKRKIVNKRIQKKEPRKLYPKLEKKVKASRYYDLVVLSVIILVGIIIYSNSFKCSFNFDDINNIVGNAKIRNLSDINAWWNFVPSRPVGNFTFALNYHFNQLDVRYWHLVNLIIHLVNACLVWWLTLLIFSSPVLNNQSIIKHKNIIAFITALLFVSHPLATQSVTYIVQRLASLAAMFYLLSLTLYVKARLLNKGDKPKYMMFAGSLISAVLAMFTKENTFTLPFAILLFELFFLRTRKFSINFKDYRVIMIIAAFAGFIIILPLKFSFSVFSPVGPQQGHTYSLTSLTYLLTQFSVIVKYIQLLFIPINQMVDYDFPISVNFFGIRTLLSFLLLLSLIILAIILFKKHRIISFGIFFFFLTLSVESSIIPIPNVIFEHRTYLPSVGFFLSLSTGVYGLAVSRFKVRASVIMLIMVIIVIINSFLTYERNKVWKDEFSLWNDNVEKAPKSVRAITNRGVAYGHLGQWDKALADYSRAIEINPEFTEAYYNSGVAYGQIGRWDKEIEYCSRAITLDPKIPASFNNRGNAKSHLKDYQGAVSDFSMAIKLDSGFTEAYYNLGFAYAGLGLLDKAIAAYSKGIGLDPNYLSAYYNRGNAYANLRQWDKAIADYSKTIGIDPKYAPAYYNRSVVYSNLGQWEKVITDCTQAIGIDPKYATAYFNRGIAYANLGQWEKAIDEYSRAIGIDPDFAEAYSNREVAFKRLSMVKKP